MAHVNLKAKLSL